MPKRDAASRLMVTERSGPRCAPRRGKSSSTEAGSGPPKHIRPSRWQACKSLADLQNVFFINHESKGIPQNRFKRRMGISDWFKPLVAAREGELFTFIGRTGSDDTDNGNERVNIAHVTLAAKAGHGGAFDVMHRAPAAARNHFPNLRVLPRFKRVQIHADAARGERRFYITHDGQAALGEHVHLDQADDLDRVHVEMRRGIAFV